MLAAMVMEAGGSDNELAAHPMVLEQEMQIPSVPLKRLPFWRSGRGQGGVEQRKGRTTLTADVSRYIRARGTPVPRAR